MIQQFIRRRNMSMKSLQGRRTPGSRDKCRTASGGRRPLDQADTWAIGPPLGSYETASTIAIIITQLESWYSFTIPQRVEGWVNLDGWLYTQTVYLPVSSHPSKY